ncbi:hypothetical protein D9M72_547590 [compost metagenome]
MCRSRSLRTTLPCGPVPAIEARSTPCWRASRRTIGLMKRRSCPSSAGRGVCPFAAYTWACPGGWGNGCVEAGAASAAAASTARPAAARAASMASSPSPSLRRTAIASPTTTLSPSATRIRPRAPADSAVSSTVAFSVSTSAMGWSMASVVPGETSQVWMDASEAPASTSGIRRISAIR